MAKPKKAAPVEHPARMNLRAEIEYILTRARAGDARVVSINELVLFSTTTRDAWILDPSDGFALCLAKDGVAQPSNVGETGTQYAIEWQGRYKIAGLMFVYLPKETPTQARSVLGYPTIEILRMIAQAKDKA